MYPKSVEINEKNLDKLIATYTRAYEAITAEIATATDWGVQNRKKIQAQIDDILSQLNQYTDDWIGENIPAYYKAGAADAVKQLENVGAEVKVAEGLNKIHQDAITGLIDDTARAFAQGLTGVSRSGQLLLGRISREAITQKLAEGMIGGKALREVRQQVKGVLMEQGLAAVVDRGGNSWTLDRYANMLFRTKLVETRNRGIANRLAENGYDLVQVSRHLGSCPLCTPFEGQVLSATGASRGYPTVAEAEAGGLFHPNCKHAINVLAPKLASMTNAYNPDTGAYDPAGKSMRGPILANVKKNMIDLANEHQEVFEEIVGSVAANQWKYKVGPVKKLDRATDKIIRDYNGDVFKLKDANRATLVINNPWDPKELEEMRKAVAKRYTIDEKSSKNKLDTTDGYAMAMINVKLPGGRIGEIQVTYKEMLAAKEAGGHKWYEIWRDVNNDHATRNNAMLQMKKLYGNAYTEALGRIGTG